MRGMVKKPAPEASASIKYGLFVHNLRIYRNLLLVSALPLETYYTIYQSKQGIVSSAADIYAGMDLGAALSVKDIAGQYELSVSSLGTQTLGLGIPAVLGGTYTFLMSE